MLDKVDVPNKKEPLKMKIREGGQQGVCWPIPDSPIGSYSTFPHVLRVPCLDQDIIYT